MANIQNNLNKIKNAVLGVDVRDSIHDGIKAINEEVENTTDRQVQLEGTFDELVINAGNSNAEVAAARVDSTGKSHGTLGKRLNNFDSQIKEKVNETEVRKISQPIEMKDLHTDVKKAMTGGSVAVVGENAVGKENLKDGSVSYEKLSFMVAPAKRSSNLFNKQDYTEFANLNENGTISKPNSVCHITHYIPIKPNTTYVHRNMVLGCFYNEQKEFISSFTGKNPFITPDNARYVRFNVSPSSLETAMILEGDKLPSTYISPLEVDAMVGEEHIYEKAIKGKHLSDGCIGQDHLNFMPIRSKNTKNLFNKYKYTEYKSLNADGTIQSNPVCHITDYMEVEADTTYTLTYINMVHFYDEFKNFISSFEDNINKKLTTPSNCKYVRGNVGVNDIDKAMFVKGDTQPSGYISCVEVDGGVNGSNIFNDSTTFDIFTDNALIENRYNLLNAIIDEADRTDDYLTLQKCTFNSWFEISPYIDYDKIIISRIICTGDAAPIFKLAYVKGNNVTEFTEGITLGEFTYGKLVQMYIKNGVDVKGQFLISWDEYMKFYNRQETFEDLTINNKYIINPNIISRGYLEPYVRPEIPPSNGGDNTPKNLDAEINFFIGYGQSWSMGFDAGVISTTQRYDNLMFNGGIRTQCTSEDPNVSMINFVPAIEESHSKTPEITQGLGETVCAGQGDMVKYLLINEDGLSSDKIKYQMLLSAPGEGSRTLMELSKGTRYFERMVEQVRQAYRIAQEQGKSFKVQALSWVQDGLGSGSQHTLYEDALEQLRVDLESEVKAITGQKTPVWLITWQRFGYGDDVGLQNRFINASEKYPYIVCSGPSYFLDTITPGSNLHFNTACQKWLGSYFGLAYKRTIIDGKKFEPLKPIKMEYQGKILLVKFHVPVPPLKFDITWVTKNENFGFNVYTSSGVEKIIKDVSIINQDTIKIVLENDTFEDTDILKYCQKGYKWGRESGQRGNLTDSQGDYIIEPSINKRLDNYCVMFSHNITLDKTK